MIKFEHVVTPSPNQMNFIIEGMRNPMNSWDKSDSDYYPDSLRNGMKYGIGENDKKLMTNLFKAGTEHRKYMRMMVVYVRITAPFYWWKEFDTYKIGTVANSCSTMHKIHSKEFTIDDFSVEHLNDKIGCHEVDGGDSFVNWMESSVDLMEDTIKSLNFWRSKYLFALKNGKYIDMEPKDIWWQMIQLLPSCYNQTRNVMLNYEVLANIYKQRKNHKLDEWRAFCDWIFTLPHYDIIVYNL